MEVKTSSEQELWPYTARQWSGKTEAQWENPSSALKHCGMGHNRRHSEKNSCLKEKQKSILLQDIVTKNT